MPLGRDSGPATGVQKGRSARREVSVTSRSVKRLAGDCLVVVTGVVMAASIPDLQDRKQELLGP